MKNLYVYFFLFAGLFFSLHSNAQCIAPSSATVATITSTCKNNGSITVHNVNGGSLDSTGVNPLTEYSIVTSSNPNQPLIGWQNDSLFNSLYPGTYTVAIRFNCGASGTGYSDSLTEIAIVDGNYQSIATNFSNIITSFCNNGSFTINASNGFVGNSGQYTYQLVSAQNATQPDASALSTVQTDNVFDSLAAGTYYVRVFDDCGNFITSSVTVPQGTVVNPFASEPVCGVPPFVENKYGCNDSTQYLLRPNALAYNPNASLNNQNTALPGTIIIVFPDGSADSSIVDSVYPGGYVNLTAAFNYIDISNFVNNGQTGPFYMKWIDACGNEFTTYKAQVDTTPIKNISPVTFSTQSCGGTQMVFGDGLSVCSVPCQTLVSGNAYSFTPLFYWQNVSYNYSMDNGTTWHALTDTFTVPCNSNYTYYTPQMAICGDTITSCQPFAFAPCRFTWPATEINSFACNGNSGIYIDPNYNTYSNSGAIKIEMTSVPAGQQAIPTTGIYNPYYSGNKLVFSGNDLNNYFLNLVPGKYVYTVTDTICGSTYTDSITLTHPHQYNISNVQVQQTCTNATINATISNNNFYDGNNEPYSQNLGDPTTYTIELIDNSNNIIQTQTQPIPDFVYYAPTDGSIKTSTIAFTNVPVGTYTIILYHDSDAYFYNPYPACSPIVDSVTVTISALDISSSVFLNCGGTTGTISVNANGGVAPYTYELYKGTVSPANLVTTQSSSLFTGLNASQTYTVRVIDNCGTGVTVSKSFAPYAVIMRQLGTACIGNNLTLYTDTIAGATYSWTKNGISLNDTTSSYNIPILSSADYGTYVITVTIAGCNSFSASRIINSASCIPMAVQLINFKVSPAGGKAYLQWQTAQEENNAGFEMERSSDGHAWQDLGFVSTKANNNGLQNLSYSGYDAKPLSGINYYRLKGISIDGTITYSNIQDVQLNGNAITVLPNPVNDLLHIVSNDPNSIKAIKITDAAGQLIYFSSTEKNEINMSNDATGIYILQIIKVNGEIQTEKIIKR